MDPKRNEIRERFALLAAENRLPHAVLLEGGNERELLALAQEIAQIAVCQGNQKKPCGQCSHCKKARSDNHPDIITVEERDKKRKTLSVDLMRWVREDAIVKPNEADRKVYVIPKSGTMTREAQNALLKLLEEPPAYGMFLLLCTRATELLPTIRSRTQRYALSQEETLTAAISETAGRIALAIAAPHEDALLLETAPLIKSRDREKFDRVLASLELILRDVCVRRAGGTAMLSDQEESVRALEKAYSHRQAMRMLEEIQQTREKNERNCNLALLITCLCAHLRQLADR